MAQAVCQAELERRYERINIEMKQQEARTIADQQREIESLVDRLERGIATIRNSADNDRGLEHEMRDVKSIGELTKFTKELVGIAGQSFPVAPYQRELENLLAEIIAGAGLPIPVKLKKNAKTAPRQSVKSPRPGQ
jgi:prefoldin subunit 5